MRIWPILALLAALLGGATVTSRPADAAPLAVTAAAAQAEAGSPLVAPVQYYRRRFHRHHGFRHRGFRHRHHYRHHRFHHHHRHHHRHFRRYRY